MNNIFLIGIETVTSLMAMIIIYKNFKDIGLYAYAIVAFILSNMMSLKMSPLYSFNINLGIAMVTSIFIAENILIQKKGSEETKKFIIYIAISGTIAYAFLYIISILPSSELNLFTNKSYDNIFLDSARLYFANIATILYMLLLNGKLYTYLKREKNKIWISNIFSGIIVQFITSCAFCIAAYAIAIDKIEIIKLIIIRYMICLLVIIIGTIFVYIANKIKND